MKWYCLLCGRGLYKNTVAAKPGQRGWWHLHEMNRTPFYCDLLLQAIGLYRWGPTPWWMRVPVRLWRFKPERYDRVRPKPKEDN